MNKYRNLKIWSVALFFLLISILTVSHEAHAANWSWDQNHDCVQGIRGKSGWCRWGYDGNPANCDEPTQECCELFCKICPVYANTGRLQKTFTDLTVPGVGPALTIIRTYNSQDWANTLFGYGWVFNFGKRLIISRNFLGEKIVGVRLETGERNFYKEYTDGTLERLTDYGATYDLINNGDGTYTILNRSGSTVELRDDGKIAKIADRNQNELVFTYNSVGCISRISNASGNYLVFQLGPNGKIASISDNLGRTVSYAYDQNANLTSFTDPLGNTTQYIYNSDNLLAQIIDARANLVESATYDNNQPPRVSTFTEKGETYTIAYFDGRTEKTDSQGNKWTYYFNDVGVIEKVVDPLGNETNRQLNKITAQSVDWEDDLNGNRTSYTYDGDANITSKTDPLGNAWTYTYIAGTNLLETETSPLGVVTKYEYDTNGNRTAIIRDLGGPLENATTYTYDSQGNQTSVTDPLGNITTYEYDANGNLTKVTDPLGNVATYTYDSRGNKLSETDALGNTTIYSYDLMDRLVSRTDSLGNTASYYYDANGNLASTQYPDGSTTTFTHDAYSRLVQVIDPSGNSRSFTYDRDDNVLTITDANGNTTRHVYDLLGRKTQVIDAEGSQTSFAYDANGNLTSMTDAVGITTTFAYDACNRVIQKNYHDGANYVYVYDAGGNKISVRDANGNTTAFSYDRLNRLIAKTYQDGSRATFTYDAMGRMLTGTTPDSSVTYSYDGLGRVYQASINEKMISYSYDSVGNRVTMTTPEGMTVQYEYNSVMQMSRLELSNGKGIDYTYDSLHRIVRKDYSGGSYSICAFDTAGRLTQIRHLKNDGTEIYTQAHDFDNAGNIISKTTGLGVTNYTYDKLYQLCSAVHPTQPQEDFTYDGVGNRLTSREYSDWIYNNRNQLTSFDGVTFSYDSNGNTVTKTDGSGSIQYACDYENRLTRIDLPDGDYLIYKYDVRGRRIEKSVNGNITKYIYDGPLLIGEYDASGNLMRNYCYSNKEINPSILCENGQTYYFLKDHLDTPHSIADENGNTLWEARYNSFGEPDVITQTVSNNFTFPGQYYDGKAKLSYNYNRFYNPEIGRYLTEDPIGIDGGYNVYLYVHNDPINSSDFLGLFKDVTGKECDIEAKRYLGFWQVGHDWIEWGNGTYGIGFYPKDGIFTKPGIVYFGNDPHTGDSGPDVHPWSLSQKLTGKLLGGIICKCVECKDMKQCIVKVGHQWHLKKKYIFPFQTCRQFVSDALKKCCIKR